MSNARNLANLLESDGDIKVAALDNAPAPTKSTIDALGIAATSLTGSQATAITDNATTAGAALPKAGGALTGAVTTNSTFDGVDIATRDGVLTSTTATAAAALPKAGGTMTGVIAGFTSTGIDDNATSTAITIDSSERVVIGATVQGAQNAVTISSTGFVQARATGVAGYFDRIGSDGSVLEIRKSGAAVGSISNVSADLIIDNSTASGGAGLALQNNSRVNPRLNQAFSDGTVDLGYSNSRWKDAYLSGGVYLGGTGAANKLDDYETGSWTPSVTGTTGGTVSSYHNRAGRYIKIGNQVTLWFYFHTQSVSGMSGSGAARINGLPFSFSSDLGNNSGMGPVSAYYLNDSSFRDINLVRATDSSMGLLGSASSNGITGNASWGNVSATAFSDTALQGVFTYRSS